MGYRTATRKEMEELWKDQPSLGMALRNAGTEIVKIAGKIGQGTKVHSLTCWVKDGVIYHVESHCGSQRWTPGRGASGLSLLPDATITCKRC